MSRWLLTWRTDDRTLVGVGRSTGHARRVVPSGLLLKLVRARLLLAEPTVAGQVVEQPSIFGGGRLGLVEFSLAASVEAVVAGAQLMVVLLAASRLEAIRFRQLLSEFLFEGLT